MIGLLVMAYGGPDNLDEVEPYLLDVRGGRATSPGIIQEVRDRYRQIGGRSPILERTQAQAAALEAALNADGQAFRAFVGMRHWRPFIREALAEMAAVGIGRAVALAMAPHYSRMSIGAYYRQVDQALAETAAPIQIARIERWHLLPGYLDALAGRVWAALERLPADRRAAAPVIFTAHSLPRRILEWGDPYPEELRATVAGVMERLGPRPHEFAYQSAALTSEAWLGPDAGEVIARLAASGNRHIVLAPVGFVTEHVEILYDVDVVFKSQAKALGAQLERIEMVNTEPHMIAGLVGLVREAAREAGWL